MNNIHNYNFVLTSELKNKIIILSKKKNLSLSDTSIYILKKVINVIKKYHYVKKEFSDFTSYQYINWDKNLHIYFDNSFFRQIKHIADMLFAFSTAVVIRWLLNYYFDNIFKNEVEDERYLRGIEKEVIKYEKEIKNWNKYNYGKELSVNLYYQLTFDNEFNVIGFNFLL